jgi:hypothetical protein
VRLPLVDAALVEVDDALQEGRVHGDRALVGVGVGIGHAAQLAPAEAAEQRQAPQENQAVALVECQEQADLLGRPRERSGVRVRLQLHHVDRVERDRAGLLPLEIQERAKCPVDAVLGRHANVLSRLADVLGHVRGAARLCREFYLLVDVVDPAEHQGAALAVHPVERDVRQHGQELVTADLAKPLDVARPGLPLAC